MENLPDFTTRNGHVRQMGQEFAVSKRGSESVGVASIDKSVTQVTCTNSDIATRDRQGGEGFEREEGSGMCAHNSHMSGSYTYAHVSAATCNAYT